MIGCSKRAVSAAWVGFAAGFAGPSFKGGTSGAVPLPRTPTAEATQDWGTLVPSAYGTFHALLGNGVPHPIRDHNCVPSLSHTPQGDSEERQHAGRN